MKRPQILFFSCYSPSNRQVASGTNYKMAEKLGEIGDLEWGEIQLTKLGLIAKMLIYGLSLFLPKKMRHEGFRFMLSKPFVNIKVKSFDKYDIIVNYFSLPYNAVINSSKPVIYFTDATFHTLLNYYPKWSNLFTFNSNKACEIEREGMEKSAALIFGSNWAAEDARDFFKQEKQKIHVVEFGANIDDKDIIDFERQYCPTQTLELLFLGVDWKRKGGDIAVETAKWLNNNGVKTNLNIIGIKKLDSSIEDLPFVINYGYLNKNIPEDYEILVEIIKKSHALLLPTIAECAGIAFCEASANGLPCFSHRTGGVPNYVLDGINGYLLPLGSTGEDFGKIIKDTITSGELEKLSVSAKEFYKERLNWNVWRDRVKEIIDHVIE